MQQEEAQALDAKSREASDSLHDLRQKLIAATEALDAGEEEQEGLEERQEKLADDIADKTAALAAERRTLNELTMALVELGRQPPKAFSCARALRAAYVHRAIALHAVVPRVREQAENIARDLVTLDALKAQMAEQQRLAIAAQRNLAAQRQSLDQLVRVRQGLLEHTQGQKQAIARQLVALTSEARDLRQLLEKVTPSHTPRAAHFEGVVPRSKRRWRDASPSISASRMPTASKTRASLSRLCPACPSRRPPPGAWCFCRFPSAVMARIT